MSVEIEETIRRLQSQKGVKGVIVCNTEGVLIKSSLPAEETEHFVSLLTQLTVKAIATITSLDSSDSLSLLRLRSKNHEIMIVPDNDYMMIVVHDPQLS